MSISELFDLRERVSIVTGGGHGLGKIMATGLAEAGSNVVVCSRKIERCEEAAHDIEKLGVKTLAVQCDLTREEDIDRLISETLKGLQRIDILINNSGRTWEIGRAHV